MRMGLKVIRLEARKAAVGKIRKKVKKYLSG
jgi:hypothetical protein